MPNDVSTRVVIPYRPRKHILPMHQSTKRWIFTVMHRRAGKSVGLVNHTGKKALENTRKFPPPRYGYVGPTFAQAKDLVWGYIKYYYGGIPGIQFSEGDLEARFPNGALFTLYGGGQAYERMRGIYFDGVVVDEYPLVHADAFDSVIKPCLADYRGWCILSGTSAGKDHFYERKREAENNPDEWDLFDVKVYDTDAIDSEEVELLRRTMRPAHFAREFLNSFDAPIEGAYYEDEFTLLEKEGRLKGRVPWDPAFPVFTCWDLGIDDQTAIWFIQRVGRAYHVIKYVENRNKGASFYTKIVKEQPYQYSAHILPTDALAREYGSGKSKQEIIDELLENDPFTTICPYHSVSDGVEAVRTFLPLCWFDEENCSAGVSALKSYQKSFSIKHDTNKTVPLHNWASHGADAFRYGAVAVDLIPNWSGSMTRGWIGAIKRRIKGIV